MSVIMKCEYTFQDPEHVVKYIAKEINFLMYPIKKFPFKRNGLPCCEDEPGSEKIALK